MKKFFTVFSVILILSAEIFAQSEGEKLFRLNKPEAAIPLLEKEITQPGADSVLYNYLGICYYQTERYEKALSVFERALTLPYSDMYMLNLNAGNAAFALSNYAKALEYFRAAAKLQPKNATPVLNSANTLLKMQKWGDAKSSYESFLDLAPNDVQAPKILALIELLNEQIEKDRLAQEALAAQTELLDDGVDLPSKNNEGISSEKIDESLVIAPVIPPESELVDENYTPENPLMPESEYVDGNLPIKTAAQIESERVAEQLAAEKKRQIDSEQINPDDKISSSLGKEQPKVVAKPVVTPLEEISSEPIDMSDLIADHEKLAAIDEVAPVVVIETPSAEIPSMLINASDLDSISGPDTIMCSVKVMTEDFSPDDDGVDDMAELILSYSNALEAPSVWSVTITDEGGAKIKTFTGRGAVPNKLAWNGLGDKGEDVVYSAAKYMVSLDVVPSANDTRRTGIKSVNSSDMLRSGILLKQTGENEWKIIVMSFRFDADAPTFDNLTAEQREELEYTLQAIVRQLKKHTDCNIIVDGYANNISGTEKENLEELIPLSASRAKIIMEELIKRGIDKSSLSYAGMGGDNPIGSRNDKSSWWKNRRVEFTIKLKSANIH